MELTDPQLPLIQKLVRKSREKSGSIASNRFDYQKDWSLCRLLEIHTSGRDYMLIFEHEDDLMVLDSEDKPEKIAFYQVKTKDSGSWNLSDLLKRIRSKKGQKYSYLGRLYANKIRYDTETESLNFISNARFNITSKKIGKGIEKIEIAISKCDPSDIKKITEQLQSEHSMTSTPNIDIVFFKVADLSLHDSANHTTGKIANFMSKTKPHKRYLPDLAYKTIFDEIRRKCNYEHECKTIEDLMKHKSISRKAFSEMLETIISPDNNTKFDWPSIQNRLNLEKEDLRAINSIRVNCIEYEAKNTDRSDVVHNKLSAIVNGLVINYLAKIKKVRNLSDFLNIIVKGYKETKFSKEHEELYVDDYIKAIALSKYHEQKL